METILAALYGTLCWLIFKVFKVPVNKWTITTAILGGAIMIGVLIGLMNYNHPFTHNARVYFVSTPVITEVSGRVDSVYVKGGGQSVRKGDTLFTLDDEIYRSRVLALYAQVKLARIRLKESRQLASVSAGTKFDVETYQSQVELYESQIREQKYNLQACVVVAATDGYVTQNRLVKGMRAVQFPLRPLMTIVNTSQGFIVGAFPQNPLQRVKVGNEAEVIFDAVPGRIFSGKVIEMGEYIAQGELQAFGTMYDFDTSHGQGAVPLLIELDEEMQEYFVPGGAKAQMAVYSEYLEPVSIIRKVLLRMKGWMNYLVGE
ncbi:hypothetical protein BFP72_00740 [Reichenbachiella sp. 5M10]|uniref:HlyD family secretion protein n=1 Tax=Reichenbachiella sp. 5M10 TaxID=1889772 RepID=UPI000C152DFC|nr:efflux RND transporter periplasmic adaptor subunit [Reichenbachiella sp. 5M10]PIB34059.1 hypothetical protein BFP72_00740 [Reichenbachiella sp. 5M10]